MRELRHTLGASSWTLRAKEECWTLSLYVSIHDMGNQSPLSPAPSADGTMQQRQMKEARANAQPQHLGQDLLGVPQGMSIYDPPLSEHDFAALNDNPTYLTPRLEAQPVSYMGERHRDGLLMPSQVESEPSGDPGSYLYNCLPAEVRQNALVSCLVLPPRVWPIDSFQARPPFTPEETPPISESVADVITTRGGRKLRKRPAPSNSGTLGDTRVQKTAKTTKKRKAQDASSILPKPLSEIAKEFPDIPVTDVAAFASRSTEERHGSSAADGKIKRPLNAFMLYRKAYQKVAMAYCGSSSHQTVSLACGASWRCLEPDNVRKKFKELADTETRKHKEAHPTYKYVPKKAGPDADVSVNPWDLGDDEYAGRGASRRVDMSVTPGAESWISEPPVYQEGYHVPPPVDMAYLGQGVGREASPYWDMSARQPLQSPYAPIPTNYGDPTMFALSDVNFWDPHVGHGLMPPALGSSGQGQGAMPGCIDPRLFDTSGPSFDNRSREHFSGPNQGGVFPSIDVGQGMAGVSGASGAMPDLDEHGAHNAYLRGSSADWVVEPLEGFGPSDHFYEASYAADWALQSDAREG